MIEFIVVVAAVIAAVLLVFMEKRLQDSFFAVLRDVLCCVVLHVWRNGATEWRSLLSRGVMT